MGGELFTIPFSTDIRQATPAHRLENCHSEALRGISLPGECQREPSADSGKIDNRQPRKSGRYKTRTCDSKPDENSPFSKQRCRIRCSWCRFASEHSRSGRGDRGVADPPRGSPSRHSETDQTLWRLVPNHPSPHRLPQARTREGRAFWIAPHLFSLRFHRDHSRPSSPPVSC